MYFSHEFSTCIFIIRQFKIRLMKLLKTPKENGILGSRAIIIYIFFAYNSKKCEVLYYMNCIAFESFLNWVKSVFFVYICVIV